MSSTDKGKKEMFANPAKMTSENKLLVLKFEDFHFESLINSLMSSFDDLDLLEIYVCNVFDDSEDGKNMFY